MSDLETNFDRYLECKLQDPGFRARFEAADRAWDIALQHLLRKLTISLLTQVDSSSWAIDMINHRRRRTRCGTTGSAHGQNRTHLHG